MIADVGGAELLPPSLKSKWGLGWLLFGLPTSKAFSLTAIGAPRFFSCRVAAGWCPRPQEESKLVRRWRQRWSWFFFWVVVRGRIQGNYFSCLCGRKRLGRPQKTKSWIKVGKLFEKLGRYENRNAVPDPHLLFREGVLDQSEIYRTFSYIRP